jgi:hypothetical protein
VEEGEIGEVVGGRCVQGGDVLEDGSSRPRGARRDDRGWEASLRRKVWAGR